MSNLDQEICEVTKFIFQLNSIEKDSIIVVEGKRDSEALKKIGCSRKILELNDFRGMVDFTDHVARYKKIIILFDRDRKGAELTGKVIRLLQRRTAVDLSYKRNLRKIGNGEIRFIEQMKRYELIQNETKAKHPFD